MAANRVGTRCRGAGWSTSSIHAERAVVKELGDVTKLRGAVLYVIRIPLAKQDEFGPNTIRDSRPCYQCYDFLCMCMRRYGLRKVYYTVGREDTGCSPKGPL